MRFGRRLVLLSILLWLGLDSVGAVRGRQEIYDDDEDDYDQELEEMRHRSERERGIHGRSGNDMEADKRR